MRKLLSIIALAAAFAGCNSSGCLENRSAIPLARFCDESGTTITVDSIEISGVGAPRDSVLQKPARISQVYLPMRSTMQTTAWCFAYKWKALDLPQYNDTITFDYTSIPYFASAECGATYRYHIDRVTYTTHLIDSVVMVDSLITNIDRVYIDIHFRTSSDNQ